ncbi:MAG: LD-carboxypeptidase [Flavobacteriaceae bacterium]|nr:LD-carboxypeptidase [Flavobacteriaceae bacterium]
MVTPPYLAIGDRVGIISTARKISRTEIQDLIDLLTEWQLQPVMGSTIDAESDQYAGDDNLRRNDLQKMLNDPSIKAIWCAKGGYGTVRLIDNLNFDSFIESPKWIIGYSDITVLHAAVQRLGFESLHANMALEIRSKTSETRQTIQQALFGKTLQVSTKASPLNRLGDASGVLVGGNLSVLYSILGSETQIDTKDRILFIEDLDEYLYHIDRMMMNLKRNGLFRSIRALIVGGMNDMNDNTIPFGKTAEEIILEAVKDYDFPVCFNFPSGHIEDNRALILGRNVHLSVNKDHVQVDF